MLSMFGGATGVLAGLGAALGVSALITLKFATWQRSLAPWSVTAALAVTFFIGIALRLACRRSARLRSIPWRRCAR